MKHKILGILCSLGVILGCFFNSDIYHAHAEKPLPANASVLTYLLNESNAGTIQEWLDSGIAEAAGKGGEWYIFVITGSGIKHDYSKYAQSLEAFLAENKVSSPIERERIALALTAIGKRDHSFVKETANNAIGEQGIMSWIFGLHLLNNGVESEKYTCEEVVDTILSLQLEDGGWAVTGRYSDVDVTAMTLQALAHTSTTAEGKQKVEAAVRRALDFLSVNQTENGGFKSYGQENAESCAQVLMALHSLGINYNTASDFIKNENTVYRALKNYVLPSGAVEHLSGGGANAIATTQTFCALSVINTPRGLYDFGFVYEEGNATVTLTPAITEAERPVTVTPVITEAAEENSKPALEKSIPPYKFTATVIILALAAAGLGIQLLRKKKNPKNYIFIALLAVAALLVVWLTRFESRDGFYNKDTDKKHVIGTVTMSITCETVIGRAEYIPANGVVLAQTEFEIEEGTSVYDLLMEAASRYGLAVVHKGTAATAYISSINGIAELDFGDLSGWMYIVNDYTPSVGCGIYKPEDGDKIEWKYTRNLGEDLK